MTGTCVPAAPAGSSILIIDDEVHLRSLMTLVLEGHGYSCRSARDGRAGLALLQAKPTDLVLLDYKMPVLDGPGFLAEARLRGFDTPVLLVTASPEARALALEYGCAGVLPKPYGSRDLVVAVQAALASRHEGDGSLKAARGSA